MGQKVQLDAYLETSECKIVQARLKRIYETPIRGERAHRLRRGWNVTGQHTN
ncbi:uncharacterized protein METZ01_LOCUS149439 [marine metagenome]|uniref:Uncharacterized protein n=1 Tax=marine metagenome TaxID=408172 RepID=A0A382A4Z1_9ZZZZ